VYVHLFNLKINSQKIKDNGFTPYEMVFGLKSKDTLDSLLSLVDYDYIELKNNEKGYNGYMDILNNIRYFKNIKWKRYLKNKWDKEQENWKKHMKIKPYKFEIGQHVMVNNLSRYAGMANQSKLSINNNPFYIITKILPFNRVNLINEKTGIIIKGIDITRILPYTPNDIIENELSNINKSIGLSSNGNIDLLYKEKFDFDSLNNIMVKEASEYVTEELITDKVEELNNKGIFENNNNDILVRENKRYNLRKTKRVNYKL